MDVCRRFLFYRSQVNLNSAKMNPFVKMFLQWLGPVCFFGLQMSSLHTGIRILNAKSVGQLSAIPFLSLLVNCVVWTLYGWMKQDYSVFWPNASGILVSFFCIYAYNRYTTISQHQQHIISICIILFVFVLAQRNDMNSIGTIGCILAVIVSGSPLAVMKTVITERSTASLPFGYSMFMWVNNCGWVLYGYLVAHDVMIYGPNALSLVLSTTQLLLFCVYGFSSGGGGVGGKHSGNGSEKKREEIPV